jgi:phosphatidate cytidylyltransferase
MKRVLTAVVLIPVVLLIVLRAPLWLFALAIAAIVLLTLHEYLSILKGYGIDPIQKLTYIVALLLIAVLFVAYEPRLWLRFPVVTPWIRFLPILICLPIIFGIPLAFRRDMHMAFPAAACSAFGVMYIALSLAMLVPLRHFPATKFLIIFTLFSVWGGDTAAYYVGRSIGRHKLAPVVSPKKTWEGAIASVLASVGIAALVFRYWTLLNGLFIQEPAGYMPLSGMSEDLPWSNVIIVGIVTNVAAQFGDLFESALKRGANIKDSGSLLPGHGGMLDRIDALLFAVPVVWYYASLSGLLQQATFYHP